MMTMVLAAVLGAGAMLFTAPRLSNAAETNSVEKNPLLHLSDASLGAADKPGHCHLRMHLVPFYAPKHEHRARDKIGRLLGRLLIGSTEAL